MAAYRTLDPTGYDAKLGRCVVPPAQTRREASACLPSRAHLTRVLLWYQE